MAQQYVALVYQGMVLDQRVVALGEDEEALKAQAEKAAEEINSQITGEAEGWTAVVVPVS